ncbi:hypothetical protein Tco_0663245 [Tanacetum coccineum]
MNDPNITMEEYIRLEEEKLKVVSSTTHLTQHPTVSPPKENQIDFRISLDESDDEDYTVTFDENSFSYKIIYVNDLKTDSEDGNGNMPTSPKPTVDYFDDLDYFKDFENEFPAIIYNDGLTSKSDLRTKPLVISECINEFNLIDETSLSEYDEEIISRFNNLFNDIHHDDLKSEKDDDDDNISIIQYLEDNEISHGENCAGDVVDFRTWPGISLETSMMSTMDLDGVTCLTVIMESLVKKKQKGAILELKRRHLKNTIFCTYTPYPAMKIRRISASSAQETRNDQFPIRRIHYNQYAVCTAVHQWFMTRSSTKELLLPLENPERVLRSTRKLFDNPSLVELNPPEEDQPSEIKEYIEEEIWHHYPLLIRGTHGSDMRSRDIPWVLYIDLAVRLRMVYSGEGQQVFVSHAWRRLFGIRGPLVREFILEFLSTCRMSDTEIGLDVADTLCFQLGEQEMAEAGLRLLGPAPSYVLIRDPVRRLCHRMIAYNIFGRGRHLRRHAEGRKSRAKLSGGHFIRRLAMHFGLVSDEGLRGLQVGPERQQATVTGTHEADEAGSSAEEVALKIPVPVPAPAQTGTTTTHHRFPRPRTIHKGSRGLRMRCTTYGVMSRAYEEMSRALPQSILESPHS